MAEGLRVTCPGMLDASPGPVLLTPSGSGGPAPGGNHLLSWFLIFLSCAAGLAAAAYLRNQTWDDSAITLGYARTLAQTGRVSFGRYGEVVEGSSSFLWMLICAGIAHATKTPEGLLRAAQGVCAVLYVVNVVMTYLLARRVVALGAGAVAAAVVTALSAVCVASVADAMENHLFLALHLLLVLLTGAWSAGSVTRARSAVISLVLVLLFTCRPEGGITFLVWAVVTAALSARGGAELPQRWMLATAPAAVVSVLFLLWRQDTFGTWVPNTVHAKMWPPYVKEGAARAVSAGRAAALFALAAAAWCVPAAIGRGALSRLGCGAGEAARAWPLPAALLGAYCVYHVYIGQQFGTDNRTFIAVFPFAIVLGSATLQQRCVRPGVVRVVAAVIVFAAVQGLFAWRYASNAVTVERVRSLVAPGFAFAEAFGATPPCVALPDTGASLLFYGDRARIIDTALLNHARAARRGWGEFGRMLDEGFRPDVIETHVSWTRLAGFDRHAVILDRYVKVSIEDRFYLVEKDVLERAQDDGGGAWVVRPAATLSEEERARILGRRFTTFTGDATGVALDWAFDIRRVESGSEAGAMSDR